MVVRLHLEHDRQAIADVDGAGVFARALQHARTIGRQPLEQFARVLVAAMFAPHRPEHSELDSVRLAAQVSHDVGVFGWQETEGA